MIGVLGLVQVTGRHSGAGHSSLAYGLAVQVLFETLYHWPRSMDLDIVLRGDRAMRLDS